jgi:uncharacterized protein (TIGR03083 family)
MGAAAEQAGLLAPVPSCPGWQVRDLLRHQGYVHRWAASYVAEQRLEMAPEVAEIEQLRGGPADSGLLDWFCAGHAALVTTLKTAAPDVVCWTFLPAPSPLAFWARRQAHETAIHRADAELAAGGALTPVTAEFAADGIDELMTGFFGRDGSRLPAEQRAGGRRSVRVCATDADLEWRLEFTGDGHRAASAGHGGGGTADCTLAGPAGGLYLLLWNRVEPGAVRVTVGGDPALLQDWRAGMRVTWE